MSFLRFWTGFTVVGLAVAALVLSWAISRRQFREPDRAGFLPLADVPDSVAPPAARTSRDAVALLGVLGLGLVALLVSVVVSWVSAG